MASRRRANLTGVALAVVPVVGFGLARVIGDVADAPASSGDEPWLREAGR